MKTRIDFITRRLNRHTFVAMVPGNYHHHIDNLVWEIMKDLREDNSPDLDRCVIDVIFTGA